MISYKYEKLVNLLIMKEFIRYIKRQSIDLVKTIKLYKYYQKDSLHSSPTGDNEVVAMFDGRLIHGGISDRLWGIISIYKYCKEHQKKFKLYFQHPFKLEDYLVPNHVDWEIRTDELVYDLRKSRPIYISMVTHDHKRMYEILRKKIKNNKKQLHIYSNTRILPKSEFSGLFHELFKKSDILEKRLELERDKMGKKYVSCTFRFQQLLGDFKEGKYEVLCDPQERINLINRCKEVLKKLRQRCGCDILVTSDSKMFLEAVDGMENVFIVRGEIKHPDYNKSGDVLHDYIKSFIDLFMIAEADEVYLCMLPPLYRSGFPETAACINNKPYYEIRGLENFEVIRW